MKRIQKILALLLACAFVFACMAGCAPKADPTEPTGTVGSTNPPKQDDATEEPTGTEAGSNEDTEPTQAKTEPIATEGDGNGATEAPTEPATEVPTEPATEGDTDSTEAPTEPPKEPLPTLDNSNLGQWVG